MNGMSWFSVTRQSVASGGGNILFLRNTPNAGFDYRTVQSGGTTYVGTEAQNKTAPTDTLLIRQNFPFTDTVRFTVGDPV